MVWNHTLKSLYNLNNEISSKSCKNKKCRKVILNVSTQKFESIKHMIGKSRGLI